MPISKKLPPIRRWSQAATDNGAGTAPAQAVGPGQQTPDPGIKLDIPSDGYICAIGAAVFDPALNANETVNLWADAASGVKMLINNESPTNFKFIRLRDFAGTGARMRRVLIKVKINDTIRIFFSNDRSAGASLQYKMDFGMCDTKDVEIDDQGKPYDDDADTGDE